MPEFHLPIESKEARVSFASLDAFTRGYIEAAFFTESGEEEQELHGKSFDDIAPSALLKVTEFCGKFQSTFGKDLDLACDYATKCEYDMTRAGHDLWYTRNGHGVGYWDRGLGQIGETLTAAAHVAGEVWPYG